MQSQDITHGGPDEQKSEGASRLTDASSNHGFALRPFTKIRLDASKSLHQFRPSRVVLRNESQRFI